MTIDFGTDLYIDPATNDADALWSTVSGVALVAQDLRVRLTTGSVNPSPEGDDYGEDLRAYPGLTADALARKQPAIKKAALKDQRIDSVAVDIATDAGANGITTSTITVAAQTALGPVRLVFLLDASKPLADQLAVIVSA
jgi:hypothetical protein